ncbi:MAG: arsenic metallochaperone ArsD family protein [Thermodesulfovibrionales bacterium]|nr:arsenic metallochaperone ArsD family protein [Thermodesulfovibrionales bacterium]
MKIEVYDPALCCSSGLCWPSIDPVLVKMNYQQRFHGKKRGFMKRHKRQENVMEAAA